MENFVFILGNIFFIKSMVAVMLYACERFPEVLKSLESTKFVYAMRLTCSWKKNVITNLCSTHEAKDSSALNIKPVANQVNCTVAEFADIISD